VYCVNGNYNVYEHTHIHVPRNNVVVLLIFIIVYLYYIEYIALYDMHYKLHTYGNFPIRPM
jgi:hypothetical protein